MHTMEVLTADELLRRVRGEFMEMPGLRLTPQQAQRLWGIDDRTCAAVLQFLVLDAFLTRSADGRYARLTEGSLPSAPLRMAKIESLTGAGGVGPKIAAV
jgi:hypothetical protein